jgi:hypothetical protein
MAVKNSRAAHGGACYLIRDSADSASFIGAALWGLGLQVNFSPAGGIGVLATTV